MRPHPRDRERATEPSLRPRRPEPLPRGGAGSGSPGSRETPALAGARRPSGHTGQRLAVLGALLVACSACASAAPTPHPEALVARGRTPDTAAWRAKVPKAGKTTGWSLPEPSHEVLANGLSLYVLHRPTPVVTVSVINRRFPETESDAGLAAFTARMLTEGTQSHPGDSFAAAFENLGATLDHSAARQAVSLSTTVLDGDFESVIELFSEAVREPRFDPATLKRVKREWQGVLAGQRDDPARLAALVGIRELLGPTAGAPPLGTSTSIAAIDVAGLGSFHSLHWRPDLSAVVVVGGVHRAACLPILRRAFASWRRPGAEPPRSPLPQRFRGPATHIVPRPDAVQTALFIAQPMPPRGADGAVARDLLNAALGGLFTSRLNQNLREEHGYTYGAYSRLLAEERFGAWLLRTNVEASVAGAALSEAVAELSAASGPRPRSAFTLEELERARAALGGDLASRAENTQRMSATLEQLFIERRPPSYFSDYLARAGAVTLRDLATEAERWLRPSELLVVAVGDQATIEPQLRALGRVPVVEDLAWLGLPNASPEPSDVGPPR